jgi:hypothetical protein
MVTLKVGKRDHIAVHLPAALVRWMEANAATNGCSLSREIERMLLACALADEPDSPTGAGAGLRTPMEVLMTPLAFGKHVIFTPELPCSVIRWLRKNAATNRLSVPREMQRLLLTRALAEEKEKQSRARVDERMQTAREEAGAVR